MAFEPDPNTQLAILDELTVDGEPDSLLAEWDQFSPLQIKEKAAPDWHGRWEKAFDPEQPRWPPGNPRAGQWRPKLGTQAPEAAASLDRTIESINVLVAQTRRNPSPEKLRSLGERIDETADWYTTEDAYRQRIVKLTKQNSALEKEHDQVRAELDKFLIRPGHDPLATPEGVAKRDALLKRSDEIENKLMDGYEQRFQAIKQFDRAHRDSIVGALERLRPMGGKLKFDAEYVGGEHGSAEMQSAFRRGETNLNEAQRLLPKAWIDDMNAAGMTTFRIHGDRIRASQRALPRSVAGAAGTPAAGEQDSWIEVNANESPMIYLHEVGHRVQATPSSNRIGDVDLRHEAEAEYLEMRTEGYPLECLNQIAPHAGYENWEMAHGDKFINPYYGKQYGGSYNDDYNELLTMSLQDLYYNNDRMRNEDPETMQWILGLLAAM